MIKNVILTGGTGVTGNALLRYLADRGIHVTVLVRRNSVRLGNIPKQENIRVVFCNLDELNTIDEELNDREYDAFFHLAWDGSMGKEKVDNRYNVELQYKNAGFFIDACELCHRLNCKKFIATGSQAEYGIVTDVMDEETPLKPVTAYGHAKVCAHGMGDILCNKYGIVFIWARLFSIYGPNDGAMSLIDTALKEMLKEHGSIPYTSGEQIWNYLYSYDAAKAMYLLADKVKESGTYCVAGAENIPLKEYICRMHETIAPDIKPLLGAREANNPVSIRVNTKKLTEATGFYEEVSFEEGIRRIADEHKKVL